jgi:hypothetical protein
MQTIFGGLVVGYRIEILVKYMDNSIYLTFWEEVGGFLGII